MLSGKHRRAKIDDPGFAMFNLLVGCSEQIHKVCLGTTVEESIAGHLEGDESQLVARWIKFIGFHWILLDSIGFY